MSLDWDQGRKLIHRVATRQHSCGPSGPPWRRLLAAPTRTPRILHMGSSRAAHWSHAWDHALPVQPPWLSEKQVIPTRNLHQTKTRKQQEDQELFIVCKVLSHACIHSCPIGSLGGGHDYNHSHLQQGTWSSERACRLPPLPASQRWWSRTPSQSFGLQCCAFSEENRPVNRTRGAW